MIAEYIASLISVPIEEYLFLAAFTFYFFLFFNNIDSIRCLLFSFHNFRIP